MLTSQFLRSETEKNCLELNVIMNSTSIVNVIIIKRTLWVQAYDMT